jgi:hypothetical protein
MAADPLRIQSVGRHEAQRVGQPLGRGLHVLVLTGVFCEPKIERCDRARNTDASKIADVTAIFWPPANRARPLVTFDSEGQVDLLPSPSGYEPDTLYVPSYFRLVKYRTMCHDARTRVPEFYAYNLAPEAFHRRRNTYEPDPRVRLVRVA